MSMTMEWCKVCNEGSLEGEPRMVACSECGFEFHLHCAIDCNELPEDTEWGAEVDSKHCPRCQGEYVDPEVKAAADMWCNTITAAKIRVMTCELFEPLEELHTTSLNLLLPTITKVDGYVLEEILRGKYRVRLGYPEPRLGDKDLSETLDIKVAKLFLKDEETDISTYASIEPAAARALAKHEGVLYLDGLTTLSDAVAEALAKHEGALSLDGLTSLTKAAAEALAKHKGSIVLNSLINLSDTVTEALAKHEGGLGLDGLTSLTDAAAAVLAKHKGDLSLSGLTTLTDAAAEALAKHKGELLLSGLTSLTDAAAEALGKNTRVSYRSLV